MRILGQMRCMVGAFFFVLAVACLNCVPQVMAEEIPKQRIQASPALLDFGEMEPGHTYTKVLKIQNTGSEVIKYNIFVSSYNVEVKDDTYVSNYKNQTQYNDIVKWVTLSQDEGEVDPGEQDEITITVKVPKDVPAGGQYAAILARLAQDANAEESAITALSQVGVVMYSSVNGNTRETGEIIENKIPSFMFTPPISATSIVENSGNVHGEATYILQVYPLIGSEEVYSNEENPETRIILPETRRLNTVSWDSAPQLGIFRVKQTVKFMDKTDVAEKVVFICPLWFLFVILAIVLLAIFWIITRMRGRKE